MPGARPESLPRTSAADAPLLSVRDLSVQFAVDGRVADAVSGIDFSIAPGERFGLVGESGSGKSVSARAVMGLLRGRGLRVGGQAHLADAGDLLSMSGAALRRLRGRDVAMVFQDPMTYLNPTMRVGEQIAEVLRYKQGASRDAARKAAVELLERVRIPDAAARARSYPWQLSGGMRQRVLIAQALACRPRLLIADEPTTALDADVRDRILELLDELVRELGTAVWLISHDLHVVGSFCSRTAVMYAGRIVEAGPTERVMESPAHPYTRALLAASKALDDGRIEPVISGQIHPPTRHPTGCRFHPRCPEVDAKCAATNPDFVDVVEGHRAACWRLQG
ncbi:MAG: ABC transporter ATP-binding protein [Deltaproteobacteria bacterium]|nr:ABC transporter ATP-binding protein [Deltaproteobacteria bacterium]MCB9488556.1 ABC transporter ATP-binding protein [Deltaproteobacteria bacterium]